MKSFQLHLFPSPIILSIFLVTSYDPIYCSSNVLWYHSCGSFFSCGAITNVGFPFWGGGIRPEKCGYPGLELSCDNNITTIIQIMDIKYLVLDINQKHRILTIARQDYLQGVCVKKFRNTTLNFDLFDYAPRSKNITVLYGCPSQYGTIPDQFTCMVHGVNRTDGWAQPGALGPNGHGCYASVVLGALGSSVKQIGNWSLIQVLGNGFDVNYKLEDEELCAKCETSKGRCGFNRRKKQTVCLCSDGSVGYTSCNQSITPSPTSVALAKTHQKERKNKSKGTVIVIASCVLGSVIIAVALLIFARKLVSSEKERRYKRDVEVMLKRYGEHAPTIYTYKEVKRMTSCFKEKLGEGGYGGVYKGKLQNGSPVAVKLLKNPNCEGAEFINEVASISGTNHVNIVTLLGYCFQERKKALVYEFMPNGSLEKYIYGGQNQNLLAWETLFQIAIGIGRGLEYLHEGCRTRILHFDIKPHNILLDAKFCPKISDFGLAKPCLPTKNLITMSGTRGTPGYIAPEVFCRGFGGASHKSDVYSFGMLVLDLVGYRKNSIVESDQESNELYFPYSVYKQFELEQDNELLGISCDEDFVLQRKLVIVGLWCIQTNPSSRPSISRAVEMLEGDLESLQIPPMPFLSSPTRRHLLRLSSHNSSTNTITF